MALLPVLGEYVLGGTDPMDAMIVFDNAPASSFTGDAYAMATTNVDWKETHTEHVIKVDVPGLKKGDVHVQIENARTLRISGQHKKEEVRKTDTWHRMERSRGQFTRKFNLPENAKVDHISATVDSGVLTIVVAKEEPKKEIVKVRTIKIGGVGGDGDLQAAEKINGNGGDEDQQAAEKINGIGGDGDQQAAEKIDSIGGDGDKQALKIEASVSKRF